jgi:hypothetical protein
MFSGDVTDKMKLPFDCSCNQNIVRPSYDALLRIRRNCIGSVEVGYSLSAICIDNSGSSGYAVGDYLQLNYGSPALIVYVTAVNSGDITNILLVNRPLFTELPSSDPLSPVVLKSSGTGATFTISVRANTASCCSCLSDAEDAPCSGANLVNISPVVYSTAR